MTKYPVASDDLIARTVGPWAEDKFYYLERVCFIFSQGMKNKWPCRCFLDLFAGPGKSVIRGTKVEIDGSPLIALACKEPFTHYYFVDENPEYIEALKKRVEKRYPSRKHVYYWAEDCNQAVKKIAEQIPDRALSLAFIDPTSVQIHMATIAELAKNRRVDLLINFPEHMSIQRIKDLKCSEEDLDRYFGSHDWKDVLTEAGQHGQSEGDALRQFYKSCLERIGYKAPSFGDQLIRSDRRRPLYYLLYASKHERGIDFWRKVTQQNHTGQRDFIGPIDQ